MKFQLKNVGKIKDAEFELKPLTVFIGANGSGKTYAASALWATINYLYTLTENVTAISPKELLSHKLYQKLMNLIEQHSDLLKENQEVQIKISPSIIKQFCKEIQDFILKNTPNILSKTFIIDFFKRSEIIFTQNNANKKYAIKICLNQFDDEDDIGFFSARISTKVEHHIILNGIKHYGTRVYSIQNHEFIDLLRYADRIIHNLVRTLYLSINTFMLKNLIYIPAARTGLMFITHNIVQNQFERMNDFSINENSNKSNNNDLTAPLNDFIAKIHNASRPKSELNTENQSFNQIMGGKLVQREGQYRFDFQPNGLEQTVPLSASSSLVTELAALSALEENIGYGTFIILEEPEAHLHLSAQREMAKLIVRLINEKGCRILLTTHSDTFLQQINNLIMLEKLSHHNENALADFGIQAAEVIAANDVAVYDFQCVGNETHVENLVCGEYGFVAKSMNDVLIALAKETQSIIEQIDDLEAE